MRGVGVSHGAVTIVNALATGTGCAVGIRLRAEAHVELDLATGSREIRTDPSANSALVRESVAEGLRRWGRGQAYEGRLEIRSEIPVSKGLKSSSAVSAAILRAIAKAMGQPTTVQEVAEGSAQASLSAGVSATGAFDDAVAGLAGGFAVTDNPGRRVLRTDPVDPECLVALWLPEGSHPPSPGLHRAFEAASAEGRSATEAARAGEYWIAMERNTAIVERLMGYTYQSVRNELRVRGALAAGVSGLGPALAAFAPRACARDVLAAFPTDGGARSLVELLPSGGEEATG